MEPGVSALMWLGKPPGTENPEISLARPALSRVYSCMKGLRESSSHKQDNIAGAPWPEGVWACGRSGYRREHTGANDIEYVKVVLADKAVEVSIDEHKARAGTPVTEKATLDVIGGDLALEERVVLQKYHR
jgi:hypothetical protein